MKKFLTTIHRNSNPKQRIIIAIFVPIATALIAIGFCYGQRIELDLEYSWFIWLFVAVIIALFEYLWFGINHEEQAISTIQNVNYEALNRLLKPVKTPPGLRRVNGFGTTLLGSFHDPKLGEKFYTRLFFTFLFVPLIPMEVYLVSHPKNSKGKHITDQYFFHGRLSKKDLIGVYGEHFVSLGSLREGIFEFIAIAGILWLIVALGNYLSK